MKIAAIAGVLTTALLVILPAKLTAQEGQVPSAEEMVRRLLIPPQIVDQLGLSEEQKVQLDKLRADLAEKHKQELMAARAQLAKVWSAMQAAREKQDREALEKLRDQNRQALSGLQGLRKEFIPQFLALLTDEQRKKVEEIRGQAGGASTPQAERKPSLAQPPKWTGHLTPLTELGTVQYKGEDGGLYGGGSNDPPKAHGEAAMKVAAKIRPLDREGKPSEDGKIGLLSVGMSNTTMEFSRFKQIADADPVKSAKVMVLDGAQGGQTGMRWADPKSALWQKVDERMQAAGLSAQQIQVVWMKQAEAGPSNHGEFPQHAKWLQGNLVKGLANLKEKFPNLRIAYLSSRIYAGYATTPLNPEPYAYEEAFAMRWLIQDQIAGKPELNYDPAHGVVKTPLLLWGPYLWADGETPRKADGLAYTREDLSTSDGTHPADTGRAKVAKLLLNFLKTDPTAKSWFTRKSALHGAQ